jgi:uncharacterized membrane protein YkvA (DUF1232 family)
VIGSLLAAVYILNPGAGVFELIPDNPPLVGNLDEAAAVTLLLGCLRGLKALRASAALPEQHVADRVSGEAV